MKRMLRVLAIMLLIVPNVLAKDLTFTWDPNSETDMAGYSLYQREAGQDYNYSSPVIPQNFSSGLLPCTIVDGGCYINGSQRTNEVDYTLNAPDGVISTYHFVVRAYDTSSLYSENSNEVEFTIDLAPIVAPTDFTGVYNSVTQTVDFTWQHADQDRVVRWGLFKSATSGTGYQNVAYIENTPPVLSTSYELPYEPGTTSYYVLVAYTAEGKYSPDSNELRIRLGPQSPLNLKVKVKVVN